MARTVEMDKLDPYRHVLGLDDAGEVEIRVSFVLHSAAEPGFRVPGERLFPNSELTDGEKRALESLMARIAVVIETEQGI